MASQGVRTTESLFEAEGLEEVVEVAYDHYGVRAAVCSRETIAVFDKDPAQNSDSWHLHCSWRAVSNDTSKGMHQGYLRKLSWTHAEFGQVIASASSDGFCCIWTEEGKGQKVMKEGEDDGNAKGGSKVWKLASSFKASRTPCIDLGFAPPQYGLRLGLCFEDGYIKLFNADDIFHLSGWQLVQEFQLGLGSSSNNNNSSLELCNCFCWRPFSQSMPEMLLIGSSKEATIWSFESNLGRWQQLMKLPSSSSLEEEEVRDVSWASACGKTSELIAYASGKTVFIVQLKDTLDQLDMNVVAECRHNCSVHQIEWNRLGTTLATSSGDGHVRMWRPDLTDEWHEMAKITS
jgi:nucleoporin SEH1